MIVLGLTTSLDMDNNVKKIVITGGSGFIGSELIKTLLEKGYQVVNLDLSPPRQKQENVIFVQVDLTNREQVEEVLREQKADAIIHLAGKNLFGRWNKKIKESIYQSRIVSTRNIVSALRKIEQKPQVLISASAVGLYGDRGEEELDESSPPSDDFLAHVCVDWEKEAREAEALGIRTVQVRTAPVLGYGGLLNKMLPIFKFGLGGPIGSGKQWFPWIHIRDIVGTYIFALENEKIHGPVNACSPEQIKNKEFSKVLAKILHRPAFLKAPKWALKLALNDLADFIVASQKVSPKKLIEAGYQFHFPRLEEALRDILKTTIDDN